MPPSRARKVERWRAHMPGSSRSRFRTLHTRLDVYTVHSPVSYASGAAHPNGPARHRLRISRSIRTVGEGTPYAVSARLPLPHNELPPLVSKTSQ